MATKGAVTTILVVLLVTMATTAAAVETPVSYNLRDETLLVKVSSQLTNLAWEPAGQRVLVGAGLGLYVADVLNIDPEHLTYDTILSQGESEPYEGPGLREWLSPAAYSLNGKYAIYTTTHDAPSERPTLSSLARCSVTATDEITWRLVMPSDLGFGYDDSSWSVSEVSMAATAVGDLLVCVVFNSTYTERDIWCMSVDQDGTPDFATKKWLVHSDGSYGSLRSPVLSPTGDVLAAELWVSDTYQKLVAFTGLLSIITGSAPPLEDTNEYTDGVVFYNNAPDGYGANPQFSPDGDWLYCSVGTCDEGHPEIPSNLDICVVTTSTIFTGPLEPYTILTASSSEAALACPRSDTRVVYVRYVKYLVSDPPLPDPLLDPLPWKLYAATVEFSRRLDLVNINMAKAIPTGEAGSAFTMDDGSNSKIDVPAGTGIESDRIIIVDELNRTGYVMITMSTPISPREEIQQACAGKVPVPRTCGPDGLRFIIPDGGDPVTLTIGYTEQQVSDVDEASLGLIEYELAKALLVDLTGIVRDPAANWIRGNITEFGDFAVVGRNLLDADHDGLTYSQELNWNGSPDEDIYNAETNPEGTDLDPNNPDTDGDGLMDGWETMDLDPATPGIQNLFNPLVADSTGNDETEGPDGIPDGQNDWDGDGMTNAEEFQFNCNPLDPASGGPVPVSSLIGLGLMVLAIGLIGFRLVPYRRY